MLSLESVRVALRGTINRSAPRGATCGEWTQTIELAGVSGCSGGFQDARGNWLETPDQIRDAIRDAAESLFTGDTSWNLLHITWSGADVTLKTEFDATIVPRAIDDPVYSVAASVRRRFWQGAGDVLPDYLGPTPHSNDYGQTRWLSPHRRAIAVRRSADMILATDGLSTPWPGVPDAVNGCSCEVFFRLPIAEQIERWSEILLSVGDMIADEGEMGLDLAEEAAAVFCRLPDELCH